MTLLRIPEWAIGSDRTVKIMLPLPIASYLNVSAVIRCQNCESRIEAKYSLNEMTGYISDGVTLLPNQPDPITGELKDVVCIQIARAQSKNFIEGIKYLEIAEPRVGESWEEGMKLIMGRQYFASYYKNKATDDYN